MKSQTIHQETVVNASPKSVYEILTTSSKFSAMSGGAPAEINPEVGGTFSCFGGMITGRNIDLIDGQRVVQAWRAGGWGSGIYSIVKFELKAEGSQTRVVLDHVGFPVESGEHLAAGWQANYMLPLQKQFA